MPFSLEPHSRSLVVGASRGIGLGLVAALLEQPASGYVYATGRAPAEAEALQALSARFPDRLRILEADVTRPATLEQAASVVNADAGRLDLLVNCAGVLHEAGGLRPERRLADVDAEHLARSFAVNATGALLLAQHFAPLLRQAGPAVLANLSARVGSIADNRLGGWYAYRAAKAAQNQITRTLAVEMARSAPALVVVALHPGTVDTALSRPFQAGVPAGKLFTAERAAAQLLAVIGSLERTDSGRFFAWDGTEIPW